MPLHFKDEAAYQAWVKRHMDMGNSPLPSVHDPMHASAEERPYTPTHYWAIEHLTLLLVLLLLSVAGVWYLLPP